MKDSKKFWPSKPLGFIKSCFAAFGRDAGAEPFIIIFLPRSGSNLLAATLDSHPEVLCHHEVFNPEAPHRSQSARDGSILIDLGTANSRDADPWKFLHMMYTNTGMTVNGVVNAPRAIGGKISPFDDRWVLLALAANRRVKKIVIDRDNNLAAYVSSLFARQTGRWVSFASGASEGSRLETVAVDPQHYRSFSQKRRLFRWLVRMFEIITVQEFLKLRYECLNDTEQFRRAYRFLGVNEEFRPAIRTRKQADRPLRARISNLDTLTAELARSGDLSLLDAE